MNYSVIWLPAAENELAALWTISGRQTDVSRAAHELDRRLSEFGPEEGESRANDLRITFVPPLAIIFLPDEFTKTVYVGRVWEFH